MRELILKSLREAVKAYPEIMDYLEGDARLMAVCYSYKIGEAPDDDVRLKDERKIKRVFAKYLEDQKKRILTYIRTHDMKSIQPSFWDDEEKKLWAEVGDDFVGVLVHGVEGGLNLLPGGGTGLPIDRDRINEAIIRYARNHRDKWLSKIEQTSRKYVEQHISNWMQSGDPLSVLIDTISNDPTGMFSKARAERIAVTEVTRLHAQGNRMAWEEAASVRQFRWNTANDELVCQICAPRNQQVYPLSQLDDMMPAHVNCRCWSTPVVDEELIQERREGVMDEIFGDGVPVEMMYGYPKDLYELTDERGYEFTVGDKTFTAGGQYNPKTGKITIYNWDKLTDAQKARMIPHEVEHAKYDYWRKKLANENKETMDLLRQGSDIFTPGGYLKPEHYDKYPATAINEQYFLRGGAGEQLKDDDGVTRYSRAYWEHANSTRRTDWIYRAVDETLAEMSKLLWMQENDPNLLGSRELENINSISDIYKKLFRSIDDLYRNK